MEPNREKHGGLQKQGETVNEGSLPSFPLSSHVQEVFGVKEKFSFFYHFESKPQCSDGAEA